ncbi:MAG: hypothetical protein AABY22_29280 [Nanoarchaeota archaeon]
MRIIGFTLSKILAERAKPLKGKLEIKSGLNIDNIEKDEINLGNSTSLRFDFTHTINYSEDIAKIEIKGSVIAIDENDESKEILKNWKKKKFDHPIKLALFNFIMEKCNLKALDLEDQISVPFHIPMPKLASKPAQTEQKAEPKNENPANYAG